MSYIYVNISDRSSALRERTLLQAELSFWRQQTEELQAKLENIPQAIEKWGFVEIIDGNKVLTLIQKPEPVPSSSVQG